MPIQTQNETLTMRVKRRAVLQRIVNPFTQSGQAHVRTVVNPNADTRNKFEVVGNRAGPSGPLREGARKEDPREPATEDTSDGT